MVKVHPHRIQSRKHLDLLLQPILQTRRQRRRAKSLHSTNKGSGIRFPGFPDLMSRKSPTTSQTEIMKISRNITLSRNQSVSIRNICKFNLLRFNRLRDKRASLRYKYILNIITNPHTRLALAAVRLPSVASRATRACGV